MPDMYPPGEYDLAGFCVGAVERDALLDESRVAAGDVILGVPSTGPHSNGYSLVRRILRHSGADLATPVGGVPLADALMAPTAIYVKPMLDLVAQVRVSGMAHITGGGLVENIIRVVPETLGVALEASALVLPPVFQWLKDAGNVADAEMWRTFNCGIGYTVIVRPADVAAAKARLGAAGLGCREIGAIEPARDDRRVRIG
jgi:phosphoribosylformylglycinamidine cyclo-ligase